MITDGDMIVIDVAMLVSRALYVPSKVSSPLSRLAAGSYHHLTIPLHDDVIKWKRFRRYWPFVRGIHRSPVNSPNKDHWRGALTFSLIWAWINDWVNNREAGDLRRHRIQYDVIVMLQRRHFGSLHFHVAYAACLHVMIISLPIPSMPHSLL